MLIQECPYRNVESTATSFIDPNNIESLHALLSLMYMAFLIFLAMLSRRA